MPQLMEKFVNVNGVLSKIREIFKCRMCLKIKNEDSIVFYWGCDHFLCLDCTSLDKPCLICSTEYEKSNSGGPVKIAENESILSIFRSLCLHTNDDSQKNVEVKQSSNRKQEKSIGLDSKEKFKTPQRITARSEPASTGKSSVVALDDSFGESSKSDTQKKDKKKLNVSKRNHKGESPLHLACRKGNVALMQELIDAGASPNLQDNAGWTPLHDSIAFGRHDVIKFLLDNGARVNTPGHENTTALHQAVTEGNVDVARLLLRHGADKNARDIYGETPLDLARKFKLDKMEEVMLNTPAKFNSSRVRLDNLITAEGKAEIILYACHLSESEKSAFDEFVNKFKYRTVNSLSSQNVASHLIVSQNEAPILNWEIVQGVLMCCHVISVKWLEDSLASNAVRSMDKYEVADDFYRGFAKSRQNRLEQLPGLFSGCHFYFGGNFEKYKTKHSTFPKSELRGLVERNGGVILSRNPDPESLALEKTIPYHAKVGSSVATTSYYIVYSEGAWDPAPKYNMSHMKTLPVEWLMESMRRFEIVDPNVDRSYTD